MKHRDKRRPALRERANLHALLLAARTLLIVAVLVLAGVGVAVAVNPPAVTHEVRHVDPAAGFPADAARAFAEAFTLDYLTRTDGQPGPAVDRWLAAQGCWDGRRSQNADHVTAGHVDVADDHRAVVTVAGRVHAEQGSRWAWLQVPVATDDTGDAWRVTSCPAPVAAPALAEVPDVDQPSRDRQASDQAADTLAAFFDAYAAGAATELAYLTVEGEPVPDGMDGSYTVDAVRNVRVGQAGDDDVYPATATVDYTTPEGERITAVYRLAVVEDGRWYVKPPVGVVPAGYAPEDEED